MLLRRVSVNVSPLFTRWGRLSSSTSLVEIGRMEEPKLYECYPAGQMFLHRMFGYRGVVLFHWASRVYDYNRLQQAGRITQDQWEVEGRTREKLKGLKPERHTYYQVLIDQRDYSQIRGLAEAITQTAEENNKALYTVVGMDYVNHEDILPYSPTNNSSLQHELFPQFFSPSGDSKSPFVSKDLLSSWHQKNICWLESVEVHRETNHNIRVTVMPFYMGSEDKEQSSTSTPIYWWKYFIRIDNMSGTRVQLQQRHWRIYSPDGLHIVKGDGVLGQQPVLSVKHPAFQYNSTVTLKAPSGHMWGTFKMEREGKLFDIRVPPFPLECPHHDEEEEET